MTGGELPKGEPYIHFIYLIYNPKLPPTRPYMVLLRTPFPKTPHLKLHLIELGVRTGLGPQKVQTENCCHDILVPSAAFQHGLKDLLGPQIRVV